MTPLGSEIRKIRASHELTLTEHAARVGVSPSYLSSLENGHRGVPTDDMLQRIVAALQVTPVEAERVTALTQFSDPKVVMNTSGLSPLATELANCLAHSIRTLEEDELAELLWLLRSAKA